MINLDQIRAHNALQHKDRIAASQGGGDAISGFPMLVLTDGLLAALAFACEWKEVKEKDLPPPQDRPEKLRIGLLKQQVQGQQTQWFKREHPGEYTVARSLSLHLQTENNRITQSASADELLAELARLNSDILLRRATAEALAFLNYLKRFVA
jgi:CRISPR/Cas system CMR-associated protein Cmr5 small subunit